MKVHVIIFRKNRHLYQANNFNKWKNRIRFHSDLLVYWSRDDFCQHFYCIKYSPNIQLWVYQSLTQNSPFLNLCTTYHLHFFNNIPGFQCSSEDRNSSSIILVQAPQPLSWKLSYTIRLKLFKMAKTSIFILSSILMLNSIPRRWKYIILALQRTTVVI